MPRQETLTFLTLKHAWRSGNHPSGLWQQQLLVAVEAVKCDLSQCVAGQGAHFAVAQIPLLREAWKMKTLLLCSLLSSSCPLQRLTSCPATPPTSLRDRDYSTLSQLFHVILSEERLKVVHGPHLYQQR